MEATLKMPAAYAVMDCEEMTYTDGGSTVTSAEVLCSLFVPFYGWYKGMVAVRDYRRANPDTWMSTGFDALTKDMDKGVNNFIYDLSNSVKVAASVFTVILIPADLFILFA
jgi:hypothetical protein